MNRGSSSSTFLEVVVEETLHTTIKLHDELICNTLLYRP